MKISVVIPLYNKAAYIRRAVDSVLAQAHTDWELIIVDDGSTDGSLKVLDDLADPRIVLVEQPNGGVAVARNNGVQRASSECVALLDADDWWAPDHLSRLSAMMVSHPGASMYGCAYIVVNATTGSRRPIALAPERTEAPDGFSLINRLADEVLHAQPLFFSSSVAVRRQALLGIGGFPVGVNMGEDLLTWMRLSCQGPVPFSAKPTCFYDEPSLFQAKPARPQHPDVVGAGLKELAAAHPEQASSLIRYLALWHRMRASMYLDCNDRRGAIAEIMAATREDRVTKKDVAFFTLSLLPHAWRRQLLAGYRLRQRRRSEL